MEYDVSRDDDLEETEFELPPDHPARSIDLSEMSTGDLLIQYRALKKALDRREREWKIKKAEMKFGLAYIRSELKPRMGGLKNLSVDGVGTAFWKKNVAVSVPDWGAFFAHLWERLQSGDPYDDVLSAFQKRVTKDYVNAWAANHEGMPPPGVNINRDNELQVRLAQESDDE